MNILKSPRNALGIFCNWKLVTWPEEGQTVARTKGSNTAEIASSSFVSIAMLLE